MVCTPRSRYWSEYIQYYYYYLQFNISNFQTGNIIYIAKLKTPLLYSIKQGEGTQQSFFKRINLTFQLRKRNKHGN